MHFLHVQCRTSLEMFCTHGMNQFKSISSLLIFLSVDVNWHIGKSYKLLFPWLIAKKKYRSKQTRISPFSCFPHSVLSVAINRVAQACDQSSLFSVNRLLLSTTATATAAVTTTATAATANSLRFVDRNGWNGTEWRCNRWRTIEFLKRIWKSVFFKRTSKCQ